MYGNVNNVTTNAYATNNKRSVERQISKEKGVYLKTSFNKSGYSSNLRQYS